MKVARIPERPGAGRLGRHVRHDPRSLRYLVAAADPATLTSVRHVRHVPVLDQGTLGACTGFAAEGCVGTGRFLEAISAANPARPTGDANADERQARALYSAATDLDGFEGAWPPVDTGSDGLSAAKACQLAGLISGYRHATTLEAALTAIAEQPVIAGINWYSTFDEPDADGLVSIGWRAELRGGHEVCVDELDVENERIGFTNSWGGGWGVGGRAFMSWRTFGELLEQDGDVTVFVPLSQPAPVPDPGPMPVPAPGSLMGLAELVRRWIREVRAWLRRHRL